MDQAINLSKYFLAVVILTAVLVCLCFLLSTSRPGKEKMSKYECGFQPFSSSALPNNVHFYRIGILFLIFDVEIMFIFPWCINFQYIHGYGHLSAFFFIIVLAAGFVVEWRRGSLFWRQFE